MERLAEHVEKADIRGSTTAQQSSPSAESQLEGTKISQSTASRPTGSASQIKDATDGNATSSTPWSIIVVLIVAATCLLWLLVKRGK
jgi:cobalamin biosynthesis Mg chelatase CobN